MYLLIVLVIVYLFVIGYLGYRGWRGTKTSADYMLAGREIHPFVMALSYGATFISTSAIVGFGGAAAVFGMGILWLTFLNILVGIFIAFVFLGGRTRSIGHHLDAHTFPELLAKRFDSKFLQVSSGLVIILFMPLYTSAVMMGAAGFIDVRLGGACNYQTALFFFSAIVALYVIMGGLKGVMYTDAMQGGIMFVAMALVLYLGYSKLGGIVPAHEALSSHAETAMKFFGKGGHRGWTSMPEAFSPMWLTLITSIVLGVGIGVLAQPQLVVRYMTVKSRRELNRAVLVGGVFILMMTGVAFVVGSLSNVYFLEKEGQRMGVVGQPALYAAGKLNRVEKKLADVDQVTPEAIAQATAEVEAELAEAVPPVVAGEVKDIIPHFMKEFMPDMLTDVLFIALIAAAMSTVSSQFHAMGTAMGRDIYESCAGGAKTDKASILATRLGIFLTFLLAVTLAYVLPEFLRPYGAVEIIARATAIFFALCAATFLPMYVGGLYTRGITKAGAIAGALAGFLSSAFWLVFVNEKPAAALQICNALFGKESLAITETGRTKWLWVDALIIGLPLSILVTIVVSLVTRKYSKEHLDNCFARVSE
jgi:SSS family solute:Na+ symporter